MPAVQEAHSKEQLRQAAPVTLFEVYFPTTQEIHFKEVPGKTQVKQEGSQRTHMKVIVLA